jgi:hypothetical protein
VRVIAWGLGGRRCRGLAAGVDPRSALSRAVGFKGYHAQFRKGPLPHGATPGAAR